MMRFSTLMKHPSDWMVGKDADTTIVVTSRVRLARNIQGVSFPGWARKQERLEAHRVIRDVVDDLSVMKNGFIHELSELDILEKQVLVERHLISREQAARAEGASAVIDRKQKLSLMVNEEDHLRMQSIMAGLQLKKAYKAILKVDQAIEKDLAFAYDESLGYLTACPTNLGTGMRASAMLHLPGLVLSEQIPQVLQAVTKIGLAVRGLFGEGTESQGHLFQISNQSTLGESEDGIIERLERVLQQVASHEANARQKMLEDRPMHMADQISRAYGVLKYAQVIDSKEAFNLISLIRMGAAIGFFPSEVMGECDELLMCIQPAHLQLHAGAELSPEERDKIRAEIIRSKLQSVECPDTSIEIGKKSDVDSDETDQLL